MGTVAVLCMSNMNLGEGQLSDGLSTTLVPSFNPVKKEGLGAQTEPVSTARISASKGNMV
jgi:hypothetical protein